MEVEKQITLEQMIMILFKIAMELKETERRQKNDKL